MLFSSLPFLYLFLPLCVLFYFLMPSIRAKNAVLLVFSLVFYAWGEPVYVLLMLGVSAANWAFGLLMERLNKKAVLVCAIVFDLGCLAVFKYAGFLVENLNALAGLSLPVPKIALPIGISFYTFQILSYIVDVYRGSVGVQHSYPRFLLYVSLFPQLIAGPIVRYSDVEKDMSARKTITEFWRRWHISLSSFFRDYLYIPLGGNRRHVVLNLAIVWALTGLWHGASWNFVLWGLYFFVLLVIERFTRKYLEKIPGVLRWAATFLLLVIGWNIFYFTDGTRLLESFRVMLGAAGTGFADEQLRISFINNLPLLILCILGSTPLPQIVGNTFGMLCASKDGGGKKSRIYVAVTYVYDLLLLALCTVALVSSTFNAFLYFHF